MKPMNPATLAWKLITGLALLLLLGGHVAAQDAWLRGQALFNSADKCIDCHTSSSKAGSTFNDINTAINGSPSSAQPCMNGTASAGCASPTGAARNLKSLSTTDITDIATYLSTPRHATFSPTSHAFDNTAVDFTPKPTRTFTLTNDGDSDRTDSTLSFSGTLTNSDVRNFSVNASACTGPLVVGQSCSVVVTFNPLDVQTSPPFSTTFGVNHNGFAGSSTATASGKGLKNLEITTASLPPFVVTPPNTSDTKVVTIENRLNSTVRLCLTDALTFSAPGDFHLVGRIPDAGPGRCATVAPPISIQAITFTPTANGPRLARLTAQRISGGALVGPLEVIALEGNVGPFMNISGERLTNNTLFTGMRQDINAGAAEPSVIALRNAGNETMRLSSISISVVTGAGGAEYTASGCTAGTTLAQGASCNLSVSFDPIDIGTRTTSLMINYSNAADTPVSRRTASIDLRGQGTRGANLLVRDAGGTTLASGSPVAFGLQNIAITYPRRLTLTNIGTDEGLAVSAPSIVPGTAVFDVVSPSVGNGCPPLAAGFALPPNASCVVDVRFLPTTVANYATSLTLAGAPVGSGAAPTPMVLALSGEGVDGRPNLAWRRDDGSALALLEVPGVTSVGTPTPPQVSLRLANLGPGAAALRLLNVIGVDSSSFALEASGAPGRCSFGESASVLGEGSTCSVVVTFRPQTAGVKTVRLQLVSTGTTPAPLDIRAQASGPAATIAPLTATPASMNLNGVRVGAQSAPAMITLANDGTVSAVVTSIDASPGFAFEPGSCGTLPFSIEPRSSCMLAVRFAPSSTGASSGSLRVQVSGVVAPVEVALQGTGAEAADVSGGGCSISDGRSPADPTLWALVLLAAAVLFNRRGRRGSASHDGRPRRAIQ
jgi:mono/diheme cytochrome c family protein